MVNNRGQVFFVQIALFTVFIILALALAAPLKSFADTARAAPTNETVGLDCANTTISNFDKANCVVTDIFPPYYVGILIFLGGAIVGLRILTQ